MDVELAEAQRAVVAHGVGPARVVGRAGTGKTTALVARFVSLVRDRGVPASRVLVLCRDRSAAVRFRDAVLPALRGGFDALPITTFAGLAADLLRRRHGDLRVLGRVEQWAVVRRLLEEEDVSGQGPRLWPTLHGWLGRRAFADEVAAAVLRYEASSPPAEELRAAAEAAGVLPRWAELAEFAARYRAELDRTGAVDGASLLARACLLLGDEAVAVEERSRFDTVLVDDFETATVAADRLLTLLAGPGADVAVAGNPAACVGSGRGESPEHLERFDRRFEVVLDVTLDRSFRTPAEPSLVVCRHPSIEPVAVAGELLAAFGRGVPWGSMAVLVRSPRRRARELARALARHGVPAATASTAVASSSDEPVVRAFVDLFRWAVDEHDTAALDRLLPSPLSGLDPMDVAAARRAGGPPDRLSELRALVASRLDDDPAAVALDVFRAGWPAVDVGGDAADDRTLDAVVAFLDGLGRFAARHPGAGLAGYLAMLDAPDVDPLGDVAGAAAVEGTEAVTITSIAAAAGREWHTVVVAGCVEGELPTISGRVRFFDPELLDGPDVPSVAERRRRSLDEERRLFDEVARTRATGAVIATSAPEPGVHVSRFVARWPRSEPALPFGDTQPPAPRRWTDGPSPVWPGRRLHLSATRLARWEDCPLRFGFEYALKARSDGNVWASFGSLVHEVLAAFLDPEVPRSRTPEELLRLADELWTDDIARYRPQREQARRELYELLDSWFRREGSHGPDVVAVERPFEFAVGDHTVTGTIDRVDRAPDGNGIEILDYKTSSSPKPAADVEDDVQLATYHLAATRDPHLAAIGPVTRLRLSFLKRNVDREQPILPDHAARTEARILAGAAGILTETFEPSVEGDCRTCDFHRLCPLQDAGREVAGE